MTIAWNWDRERLANVTNTWAQKDRAAARFPFWALAAVMSFDFLPVFDPSDPQNSSGTDVVELARIRWAAGTAFTSVDLCAALLGVRHLGLSIDHKTAALGDFIPSKHRRNDAKKAQARCAQLPGSALQWKDSVWMDQNYQSVRRARHPFTHSALARRVRVQLGDHNAPREHFAFGPNNAELSSNEIVDLSLTVAMRHVSAFFEQLEAGAI
jgi:hypothetical protein